MGDTGINFRCIRCEYRPKDGEAEGLTQCPQCGTRATPLADSEDVTIEINWHELRILGIFAERWAQEIKDEEQGGSANSSQRTVAIICGRLQAQHPDRAPLTMSGEIASLRQMPGISNVEMTGGFDEDEEANDAT